MITATLNIAVGQTTSQAINVSRFMVGAVYIPVAHDGATLGFTGAPTEGGSYQTISDSDGNAISIASNAAGVIGFSGAELDAMANQMWIKAVSAGAEDPAREITLYLTPK